MVPFTVPVGVLTVTATPMKDYALKKENFNEGKKNLYF